MNIKCLVLDHDDTTVNSTPSIHYPAFLKILEELRPGTFYTQEEFLIANLTPGIVEFYENELGFTERDMQREQEIWKNYIADVIPPFFPGMPELISRFRKAGGTVCVVSHSYPEYIRRDYEHAGIPAPELIFGADADRTKCKPYPWPLEEIMRITGYQPDELLMVDDLTPGLEMAKQCGVRFAACGWGYENPVIREIMLKNADFYLNSLHDLELLLFPGEEA